MKKGLYVVPSHKYGLGTFINNVQGSVDQDTGKYTGGLFSGMSEGLGNAMGAIGSAVGGVAGGLIGGGRTSAAGDIIGGLGKAASAIPGPWGAIAGVGLGAISGLTNAAFGVKLNQENINAVNNNITAMNSFQSNAGNFDALAQNFMSQPTSMRFNQNFIGKNGWFNKGATRKYNELVAQQDAAQQFVDNSLINNMNNITTTQNQNLLANYAAFGGPLSSHGADWNTGLNYVGNGGSHEENPYDGVPMGIAPDGLPNLVEEGEVIWNNDYVFSKRLRVPKAIRRKYKLGGVKPLTFAEAAMKANKEAEERPNDPITLRGRDAVLGILAEVQENKRIQKEAKEQQEDMLLQQELPMIAANGGHLFDNGGWPQFTYTPKNYIDNPFLVPPVGDRLVKWTPYEDPTYRRKLITDYVTGLSSSDYNALINTIGGKALNYKDNPQGLIDYAYSPPYADVYNGIWNSFGASRGRSGISVEPGGKQALTSLATPPIVPDAKGVSTNKWNLNLPRFINGKDYYPKEAILRYAPVVGSAISVLNDIFGGANKPTGERGAAIRNAVRGLRDVSFDPVGGYMAPNPTDLDYILNALNGGAGANRDALLNTAGGNRGTAMAGILASDNQYLNAIGNARLATEKENFERELKRKEFNAKLDEFNKTGMLQAAIRNQGKDEVVAKYLALAADADAQEKLLSNSTISADFTNLFDNLGRVGEDALNRADTRWLAQNWPGANAPSSYGKQKVIGYQMGLDGQYIPIYGKNGGKLNKKRRK